MKSKIIDLGLWQMISAYVFVLIVILLTKMKNLDREKQIILACFRMTLQLTIVGYLLIYIFESKSIIMTISVVAIMELFAIRNIVKLTKFKVSKYMLKVIAFSLVVGTITCIIYFLYVVIRINPPFNPQYVIPISGMLLGNSMTGISIGINRLNDDMKSGSKDIEAYLMLGADARTASSNAIKNSFDAAILPTINSMMSIGIVSLPGMMTGQILSGISPIISIKYQIAIMLGILGSCSLSVFLFITYAYKAYFNKDIQLIVKQTD